MPYKSEKIKIEKTIHDKRRKLTDDQKAEIKENKLGLSQRKLALMYNVSRRLISFIQDPAKLEANILQRKANHGNEKAPQTQANIVFSRNNQY